MSAAAAALYPKSGKENCRQSLAFEAGLFLHHDRCGEAMAAFIQLMRMR